MAGILVHSNVTLRQRAEARTRVLSRAALHDWSFEGLFLGLALAAVPLSIAVAEALLTLACATRLLSWKRGQAWVVHRRAFRVWSIWAGLEVLSWRASVEPATGWSEIRHLLLIICLFFILPALGRHEHQLAVWKGVFFSSAVGSAFLIGDFGVRLFEYRREIAAGDPVSLYLRTGGLLNHWMVYGTVEILIVGGLVSFLWHYPAERRRWWPVAALNLLAIVFSLTRALWLACFLVVTIALLWRRSKWVWLMPLAPVCLYFVAAGPIRSRLSESLQADYYSNAERLQMLKVGSEMIREKPLTGVGPGRIEKLYRGYLSSGDPVPAYHGHLHNNLVQLAAEFGVPVTLAALFFVAFLFRELWKSSKAAKSADSKFVAHGGMLALIGFLTVGLFDYTYGHSLALILLSFAVLAPLRPPAALPAEIAADGSASRNEAVASTSYSKVRNE